jgi:hypothetical protein
MTPVEDPLPSQVEVIAVSRPAQSPSAQPAVRTARALWALPGLFALVAFVTVVTGCGRGDIEEAQRAWLEDQHLLEKRLLEVRNDHDALLRRLEPIDAANLVDSVAVDRLSRALMLVRENEARLDAIDTIIDRHQLARDVAIRADDAAAVDAGWKAAKVDYDASLAALDMIAMQNDEVEDLAEGINSRSTNDSVATAGDSSGAGVSGNGETSDSERTDRGRSSKPKSIDNTIGRDAPEEPGE